MNRLVIGLAVVGLSAAAGIASAAEDYPKRSIRLVVPFPPGAGADFTARTIGQELAKALGQTVVVDNKAGANGIIGTENAVRSAADGHTILLVDRSVTSINPSLYKRLPYDPLKDLDYVAIAVNAPYALVVNGDTPFKTLDDLVKAAKAAPGKINYGSFGIGSLPQLDIEAFKSLAGIDLVHVPYKGAAPAVAATAAGEVSLTVSSIPSVRGQIAEKRLKALAVSSEKRSPLLPDVPTMKEAGGGDTLVHTYFGFAVPKGTPPEIIARLNKEITQIVSQPEVAARLVNAGLEPAPSTGTEMRDIVASDIERFRGLVKQIGIQPE